MHLLVFADLYELIACTQSFAAILNQIPTQYNRVYVQT